MANLNIKLDLYKQSKNKDATELREGFANGFRLGYTGPRQPKKSKNLVSVAENMLEVENKIKGEVDNGRVEGPFEGPPMNNLRCSPIGLVPTNPTNPSFVLARGQIRQ